MSDSRASQFINIRGKIDPREYYKRPARQQIVGDSNRTQVIPDGTVYNIWYNRYQGGERKKFNHVDKATTRCVLARDAGRTRARPKAFHCVHFARGACNRGANCVFVHNVPLEDFTEKAYDCFGRERFRDEREDMGGVGSFERENKTLYVGNVPIGNNMDELVAKHFSEWGDIEYLRVTPGRGVVYVRYKYRAQAEFAKEAMNGQALDGNEVLQVKWGSDDPNPQVLAQMKRVNVEKVYSALGEQLPQVGELGNVLDYQGYYEDQVSKKRKAEDSKEKQIDIGPTDVPTIQNPDKFATGEFDYAKYYEQMAQYAQIYGQDNSVYQSNEGYVQDASEFGYDNSAYAYTEGPVTNEKESGNEPSPKKAKTNGLVAYGSDEEE